MMELKNLWIILENDEFIVFFFVLFETQIQPMYMRILRIYHNYEILHKL